MSSNSEWELAPECKRDEIAERIVDHFQRDLPGPSDVHREAQAEMEALVAGYKEKSDLAKKLAEELEAEREAILKRIGGVAGTMQIGKHVVTVRQEERAGSVDYKRLLKDKEITEEILSQYRKPSTQYQKLEVRKLA